MYTVNVRKGYEWDVCVKLSEMNVMFRFVKSSWDSSYTFYVKDDPSSIKKSLGYMCIN